MEFTEQDIRNWKAYERVRKSGRYNMFDPNARRLAKLAADVYCFVMEHYSELKEAAAKRDREIAADMKRDQLRDDKLCGG